MGAIGFKCAGGHWSGLFISNSGEIIKTFLPTVNNKQWHSEIFTSGKKYRSFN